MMKIEMLLGCFWTRLFCFGLLVLVGHCVTLFEPAKLNLSNNIYENKLHWYAVGGYHQINGDDGEIAINMTTRYYCWSNGYISSSDLYELIGNSGTRGPSTILNDSNSNMHIECGIPGAAWLMYPDTTYNITLYNYLTGVGRSNDGKGRFRDPDVINIHTHGVHVNPNVDDIVLIKLYPICPNKTNMNVSFWLCADGGGTWAYNHSYLYHIPSDHYPGSHWYHPHWEGTLTLHVGGGMYGAINILPSENSDENSYEPNIAPENDHNLLISYVYLVDNDICKPFLYLDYCGPPGYVSILKEEIGIKVFNFPIQSTCIIYCWLSSTQIGDKQYTNSGIKYDVQFAGILDSYTSFQSFLVNGQYKPTLNMETYEWHRLRIVNTNMEYLLFELRNGSSIVDDSICQLWYIASDGIYFEKGPRLMSSPPYNGSIVIPPGGGADIEIICFESGVFAAFASNDTRDTHLQNAPVPRQPYLLFYFDVTINDNLNSDINNVDYNNNCTEWNSDKLQCHPLPYSYSHYLTDTRDLDYPNLTSNCLKYPNLGTINNGKLSQCSIVFERTTANALQTQVSINGIAFEYTSGNDNNANPMLLIPTNTTFEFLVTSNFHTFHQHTWPFQIQRDIVDGWLAKAGDWRDTLAGSGSYIVRSNLVDFQSGKLVHHCHFVPHEDHGMMAFHELMEYDDFAREYGEIGPIEPANTSEYKVQVPPSPAQDCESEHLGISFVHSVDVDTSMYYILTRFKYNDECLLGYEIITRFRSGRVPNAWFGLGFFGNYENDWTSESMNGSAVAWSLETFDKKRLRNVAAKEMSLQGWDTAIDSTSRSKGPIKCSKTANITRHDTREYAQWFCIETLGMSSNWTNVNLTRYNKMNIPFGYIWSYGEGQFQYSAMHSDRGSCAMYFYDYDDNNNFKGLNVSDIFHCKHEGNIITNVPLSTIKGIVDFSVSNGDSAYDYMTSLITTDTNVFMEKSGYQSYDDAPCNRPIAYKCICILIAYLLSG